LESSKRFKEDKIDILNLKISKHFTGKGVERSGRAKKKSGKSRFLRMKKNSLFPKRCLQAMACRNVVVIRFNSKEKLAGYICPLQID